MSTAALLPFSSSLLPVTADAVCMRKAESQGCAKTFRLGVLGRGARNELCKSAFRQRKKSRKETLIKSKTCSFHTLTLSVYATKDPVCGKSSETTKSKRTV